MKVFHVGDRIKLSSELLQYSANDRWIGKRGTVTNICGSYCRVKWDHLENTSLEPQDYIEKVYE